MPKGLGEARRGPKLPIHRNQHSPNETVTPLDGEAF
jgi:hypothetical protein